MEKIHSCHRLQRKSWKEGKSFLVATVRIDSMRIRHRDCASYEVTWLSSSFKIKPSYPPPAVIIQRRREVSWPSKINGCIHSHIDVLRLWWQPDGMPRCLVLGYSVSVHCRLARWNGRNLTISRFKVQICQTLMWILWRRRVSILWQSCRLHGICSILCGAVSSSWRLPCWKSPWQLNLCQGSRPLSQMLISMKRLGR